MEQSIEELKHMGDQPIVGPLPPLSIEQTKPTRFGKFKVKVSNAKEKYNALFDEEKSIHRFEYGVLASKFILLITLLVVSFVNANGIFIGEHPREFLTEAVTVGGTTALATAVIGISRFADTATILNAMFIAFLVFFIFHVLMEFSGMNLEESRVEPKEPDNPNLTEEDKAKLKEKQEKEKHNLYWASTVAYGAIALITVIIFPLAIRVWDFKNFTKNKSIAGKYLFEMASFGLLSGAPIYMIDKNRNATNEAALMHSGKVMGIFSILYLGLQSGGFFSNIFGEMPSSSSFSKPANYGIGVDISEIKMM